jgi:hypothetical protein
VVTVSTTTDCTAPDIVASASEALSIVEPGGIVQFESGGLRNYLAQDITVAKPVTFQSADAGVPVIEARGGSGFVVNGVTAGTVGFQGLSLVGTSGTARIQAVGTYDQVLVDGSSISISGTSGVYVGGSTVPGNLVTVSNNTFTFTPGGLMAVFVPAGAADILGNTVTGPMGWGAFQHQGTGTGRIENNVATLCGPQGCINAIGGAGATVMGNIVSSEPGRGTSRGIRVSSAGALVTGNRVDGGFTGGDPTVAANYGYSAGGIQISGGTNQTVSVNDVSGAVLGLEGNASIAAATDNVITTVMTVFSGTFGTGPLTFNDVSNYVSPFTVTFGTGQLQCNWWGVATGPQNIPGGAAVTIYTPWATAPIARNAGGQCDGR